MIFRDKNEEKKEHDSRTSINAKPYRKTRENGEYSGKSATAGPNPSIRRSPK